MNTGAHAHLGPNLLEAQGFKAPGPKLIQRVADTIAQSDDAPAGERIHQFDYAELLADTPELIDLTEAR